ncbi:hypothetical protein DEO23_13335 [Brachybacterium endophyticum]|uniref:DUF403 domain-containing protein n=1 Tax=Brachybacterium endophyticum TaxID=2182385 RepID=A0A2U2RI78_9MICO|nr:alpha-E domain-containing protein [Brachybacterium endophyticum]PWH05541.1 hypothetical protein DEO23_13335 [Brachybacterium endophyticum]
MLSRIADSLFWIGRYVERADQTARILEVNLEAIMEDTGSERGPRCAEVMRIFGAAHEEDQDLSVQAVLDELAIDRGNPSSIAGALKVARENARGAREVLPTEVWESLNTTTLELPRSLRPARMHRFFQTTKDRCAVVTGLVDASLPRDEAWLFLRLGQQLERIDMFSRILQSHDPTDTTGATTIMLLRSCSADEAYIRSFRGQVRVDDAVAFLLLDRIFPRSIAHCLLQADEALEVLGKLHGQTFDRFGTEDAARRIVGRIEASLRFRPLADVMEDFEREMEQVQIAASAASRAIDAQYFDPDLPPGA